MVPFKRIKLYFVLWWWDLKDLPAKIKRRIWNKNILLWWNRLWIRENEFHSSLDMDGEAMLEMNKKEREEYLIDLCKRRDIAHQRDFETT